MSIYRNGSEVVLEFPDAAQLTLPLIQPVATGGTGTRVYRYAAGTFPADGSDMLFVTASGHWYRMDDEQDPARPMPCRGCGAAEVTYADLGATDRCLRPPTSQDIADVLLGRSAVSA